VSHVQGRAVKVTPHKKVTAKIKSVITIGKEELTGAEASRAGLILEAFKGSDSLLSSPFVRKIFFPNFPLHTLKWPNLPKSQPKNTFTHRPLNVSQQKAVERCLSNKEVDRHVVVVVSPTSWFSLPISRRVLGAARDWEDHCDRRHCSEQGRRA
jgi:regulator of nonsense transcripts 1